MSVLPFAFDYRFDELVAVSEGADPIEQHREPILVTPPARKQAWIEPRPAYHDGGDPVEPMHALTLPLCSQDPTADGYNVRSRASPTLTVNCVTASSAVEPPFHSRRIPLARSGMSDRADGGS